MCVCICDVHLSSVTVTGELVEKYLEDTIRDETDWGVDLDTGKTAMMSGDKRVPYNVSSPV